MKTIIITGTSSGIGLTLAEYFGKKGHNVYGLSRKYTENHFFTSIPTDITDNQQVKNAINRILQNESTIDILINNAGMGMVGAIEDSSQKEILKLFNLNLIGSIHTIQAVLPIMRKQKFGRIINISSIGSEMGLPFRGFYSASKSALDKVTEAIRYEVSHWNIQICSLHLGDIKTNIADNRVHSKVSEPYKIVFNKVYQLMNSHVNDGTEPIKVAEYIQNLLLKNTWKVHYYFGKPSQCLGVYLKRFLPQSIFERMIKQYTQS